MKLREVVPVCSVRVEAHTVCGEEGTLETHKLLHPSEVVNTHQYHLVENTK